MEGNENKTFRIEEIANSATHAIGLLLSIVGAVVLVVLATFRGDAWRIVSFSIYGSSLIVLYTASALYHLCHGPSIGHMERVLKTIDHSAIYLLIAGTYTPFTLVLLRGTLGWFLFLAIWGMALTGIIFKIFFVNRFLILSTSSYLIMGWFALVAIYPIARKIPSGAIVWLIIGGVLYSLGIIFLFLEKRPFYHAIWHLFVVGGSICHYFAILFYVLPLEG